MVALSVACRAGHWAAWRAVSMAAWSADIEVTLVDIVFCL